MARGRILVVGGIGSPGSHVATALRMVGYGVRVMASDASLERTERPANVEFATADAISGDGIGEAVAGCVGVHIGAVVGGGSGDVHEAEAVGTANIVAAAREASVERITYVSGSTVSERNAWYPGTRAKLRAEEIVRESGIPYTIFCPSWIMESLPKLIRGNRATILGKLRFPWHWVAAEDFARMVARSYDTPETEGKRLFVHGPEKHTLEEALRIYCEAAMTDYTITVYPVWKIWAISLLARRPQMRAMLPSVRYMAKVPEMGDPTGANDLLGPPATTLTEWADARKAEMGRSVDDGS